MLTLYPLPSFCLLLIYHRGQRPNRELTQHSVLYNLGGGVGWTGRDLYCDHRSVPLVLTDHLPSSLPGFPLMGKTEQSRTEWHTNFASGVGT